MAGNGSALQAGVSSSMLQASGVLPPGAYPVLPAPLDAPPSYGASISQPSQVRPGVTGHGVRPHRRPAMTAAEKATFSSFLSFGMLGVGKDSVFLCMLIAESC